MSARNKGSKANGKGEHAGIAPALAGNPSGSAAPVVPQGEVQQAAGEIPLQTASGAATAVAPVDVLGKADEFLKSQADSRQAIIDSLMAAEEQVLTDDAERKRINTEKLSGIHQRLAALGINKEPIVSDLAPDAPRRGRKPGSINKPKASTAATPRASGKQGLNKTFIVLTALVNGSKAKKGGMTIGEVFDIVSKGKPPLSRTETATGLQALKLAKPPRAIYTPSDGPGGRGGHFKPTKDGVAVVTAGMK